MVSKQFAETDRYGAGVDPAGWRPIETAPKDGTHIEVMAQDYELPFVIKREGGFVNEDGEDCFGWVAVKRGAHPPCWSGGVCWDSNENEMPSARPTKWRLPTLPTLTTPGGSDGR